MAELPIHLHRQWHDSHCSVFHISFCAMLILLPREKGKNQIIYIYISDRFYDGLAVCLFAL